MNYFMKDIEKNIAGNSERALLIAMHYYKLPMELSRPQKGDVYASVHGKNAGGSFQVVKEVFWGITQSDDFSSSDGYNSGNFEEGFLFTTEKEIKVGDRIKIDLGGGIRYFKVETMEDIGFTTDMFVKWKLSNMN